MYEIGKVYIWQNCPGVKAKFNGMETTVTTAMTDIYVNQHDVTIRAQWTDTLGDDGYFVGALPGQLRPKNPPNGERKVMEQFQPKPELEPA